MSLKELARKMLSLGGRPERDWIDDDFYRSTNPDVSRAGVNPFDHFMEHGWREGRNPSARFNTLFYRDAYLRGEAVNPLLHFLDGRRAGVAASPLPPSSVAFLDVQRALTRDLFDAPFYELQVGNERIPDLLTHYLTVGWTRGLAPSAIFDVNRYAAENPFVKALDVSPLYHFASQKRFRAHVAGDAVAPARETVALTKAERRAIEAVIKPDFDHAYYLAMNRDVAKAGTDPLAHFIEHGWREGRNPTPLFDCAYYLKTNREVDASGVNPFYHYVTKGRAAGLRGSPVGSRLHPAMVAPTDAEWRTVTPRADTARADYVVIMPVYKGFDTTLAAIHAVLAAGQATSFALHVIDDKSPDQRLSKALADLAEDGLFSYDRNPVNLGFVKSVNSGLRKFADKEIVLLNSDAKVFGDWLDRIAAHADADPRIATITPFSNNATICSYPVDNRDNIVELEVPAETIDSFAARCNAGRVRDIPTGVGFCFSMSRASRAAVGILDEDAFGRGYGEENDFCMRAAKAGFRNVLAEDVFVHHVGQVSFSETATDACEDGQKALAAKHPDYPLKIKSYLQAETVDIGRARLDLFRLAQALGSKSVVFISHALAGGIVTHMDHMERRLGEEGMAVVHIKVGVGTRWGVEVSCDAANAPFCPNTVPMAFHHLRGALSDFLRWLAPKAIHVHSLVGFDWAATTALMDLVKGSASPYFFTLHDYSVVCHRNDLVRVDGTFCGLAAIPDCRTCVATDRSDLEGVDPDIRRRVYATFLNGAAGVFAPSEDIKRRLIAAGATYAITVRPHEEDGAFIQLPRPSGAAESVTVAVIGAIGVHKGSRVILNLARDAEARALPIRFRVIGYSDLTEDMAAAGVIETGKYKSAEAAIEHLRCLEPDCVFLPSIWPETYCYALSMATRAGIPPVVFDLGAQADRVREASFGFVLPYALVDHVKDLNDRLCALPYRDAERAVGGQDEILYPALLTDYYGLDDEPRRIHEPRDGTGLGSGSREATLSASNAKRDESFELERRPL